MDCRECQDKLSLYLDGQLTERERLRVETEIEECQDCAKEYESLKLLVCELNSLGPAPVPATLLSDLQAAFRSEIAAAAEVEDSRPRRSFYSYFGPWRAAAALLLGLVTLLVIARDLGLGGGPGTAQHEVAQRDQSAAAKVEDKSGGLASRQPSMSPAASKLVEEDDFASEFEDEKEPNLDLEVAEERWIDSWSGVVDRMKVAVEKRGMVPVESNEATEGFLAGAVAQAVGKDMEKGSVKTEVPEKARSRGSPRRVTHAKKGELEAPSKKELKELQAQSYIVLGRDSVTKITRIAEKHELKLLFVAIKNLGDGTDGDDQAPALETEVHLSAADLASFLKDLKTSPGLTIRLFARSTSTDPRLKDDDGAAQILHLILPRP